MYKIKEKLGFGSVTTYVQKNETYYRYAVAGFESVTRLIYLMEI